MQHSPSSSHSPNNVDPGFVMHVVRLWWCAAVPLGLLLGAGAATYVWYTWQPDYLARASVLISQPGALFGSSVLEKNFAEKQRSLIRGRRVLSSALEEDALAEMGSLWDAKRDPVDVLAEKIRVHQGAGDENHITCTSKNPEEAKTIVNTVLDSFIDYSRHLQTENAEFIMKQLNDEIELQNNQVKLLQRRKADKASTLVPVEPTIGQPTQVLGLAPINQQTSKIVDYEVELRLLRGKIDLVKSREIQQLGDAPLQSPQLAAMDAQIAALEDSIRSRERRVISKDDPKLVTLREDLERVRKDREEVAVILKQATQENFRAAAEGARVEELTSLVNQCRSLESKLQIAREQRKEMLDELTSLADDRIDYELVSQEMNEANDLATRLRQRHLLISMELRDPRRIQKPIHAETTHPTELLPIKLMSMAGGAGFCLPFVFFGLLELRGRRLNNASDLGDSEATPVIGEVVALPTGRRGSSSRAMRVYEDSVDNLRTYISLRWSDEKHQVIVVCSASSSEGKTTISSQLAASMARTSGKVLLIDGDTRMPDLHAVFQIDQDAGLVDVLRGDMSPDEAIVSSSANLDVLPSGHLRCNPHKLFQGSAFLELLDWARDRYDHIVIDTPPVLAAAEALIMARHADRTIVCAMRDVSRIDQVRLTQKRLLSAGAKLSGLVFSGVSRKQYSYRYGDYQYGY